MAYYDSFTKKPQNKRDDWRDDEMTRRPARDEGRAVEPERRLCAGFRNPLEGIYGRKNSLSRIQ